MFYRWTRDLHLYFGLFISPFLLLFATSVFFLNHAKISPDNWKSVETVSNLSIPDGIPGAQGRDALERALTILPQVGVTGEVGFTRYVKQTGHFIFPVSKPGLETNVDVDLASATATVSRRPTSVLEAFGYLHKMPGPHNVAIRGNWLFTQIWKWFADATVYLTLFITLSGIYLWWAIKAERRTGLVLLGLGASTFFGLVYLVIGG